MKTEQTTLYDTDFVEWTECTAQLLRKGRFEELDIEHLAEEIEDMGKRERREVENRLSLLLSHLLKWQFQPEHRSRSWKSTVTSQRIALAKILKDAPSLKRHMADALNECYQDAIQLAVAETDLDRDKFPPECPLNLDQILNKEYLP